MSTSARPSPALAGRFRRKGSSMCVGSAALIWARYSRSSPRSGASGFPWISAHLAVGDLVAAPYGRPRDPLAAVAYPGAGLAGPVASHRTGSGNEPPRGNVVPRLSIRCFEAAARGSSARSGGGLPRRATSRPLRCMPRSSELDIDREWTRAFRRTTIVPSGASSRAGRWCSGFSREAAPSRAK